MRRLTLLLLLGLSLTAMGEPLAWDTLKLAPGQDAKHLRALLQAVPAKAQGWKHYPLRAGGNFLSERWMKGEGDVLNDHFMNAPGSAWYKIEALHYDLPEAFGCLLSAGRNPVKDGVGVRFWYASGGQRIVGEGADLDFTVWKGGNAIAKLPVLRVVPDLPDPYEIEAALLADDWRAKLPKLADLTSFQASTAARYEATEAAFAEALQAGRVKKRLYGEYQGGGIPPESHLEPISAAEADELRRHVATQIGAWRRTLEQHGAEMFEALHDTVPLGALI